MFLSDYHTALTVALGLLLLLAVIRIQQMRKRGAPEQSAEANGSEIGMVSELLEHEEITPLLNDLASKVEAEFGFGWTEFSIDREDYQDGLAESRAEKSSRLIRIDRDMSIRFRWRRTQGVGEGSMPEAELETVERLTRACVLNIRRIQHYKRLANRDPLTGLFNAAYLRLRLKEEIERARRFKRTVGALILDVDHFKQINDTRGHLTGDQTLIFLAKLALESVRSIDIVCRYGGDELCIILPDASESTIMATMERLLKVIRDSSAEVTGVDLTVSIGGALSVLGALSPDELFEDADKAMLTAKRNGRDQLFFIAPIASVSDYRRPG